MRSLIVLLLLPVASGFAIGDVAQYDVTGDQDYQIQLRVLGYETIVGQNATAVRAPVVEMVNSLYPDLVSRLFVGSNECETWSSYLWEDRQELRQDHHNRCSYLVTECILGPISVCPYKVESVRQIDGQNLTRYVAYDGGISVEVGVDWPLVHEWGDDHYALTGLERGNIPMIAPEYLGPVDVRMAQNDSWQGTQNWLTPPQTIFNAIETDPVAILALERFRMDYGEPVPLDIVGRVAYADAQTQVGANQGHDAKVTYGSWTSPYTMEIRLNFLFQATGIIVEASTPRQEMFLPVWGPAPDLGWSHAHLPFTGEEIWFASQFAGAPNQMLSTGFFGQSSMDSGWDWSIRSDGYEMFREQNRTYLAPGLIPIPGYESPEAKESPPFVPLDQGSPATESEGVGFMPIAGATGVAAAAFMAFWLLRVARSNVLDHPARKHIFDAIAREPGIHFSKLREQSEMGNGQLEGHLRHLAKADLIMSKMVNGYRCFVLRDAAVRGVFEKHLAKSQGALLVSEALEAGQTGVANIANATGLDPSTVSYHLKRLG